MITFQLAPRLRPGDKIGIITPSWCGPALIPHRVERGLHQLQSLGYRVALGPCATGRQGYLSGSPEDRAAEIHGFFRDPDTRAIIAAIGGNHSCHLLPHLDWDLIRENPKIFMGFSDVTVLNLAIHARTGLVTFNGPALMPDLGEYPEPFAYTLDSLARTLTRAEAPGPISPAPEWTEERLDWSTQADLSRARIRQRSPGWTWLKPGMGRGPLVGGCLESLEHLRGTPFWPETAGAILFLETSENVPTPAWVDAVLQDYENMGVLGQISGLLVGRPIHYSEGQKADLHRVLLERTRRYSFPVIADMDFGHTAPQLVLPIGVTAEIDSEARRFAITGPAVA